MGNQPNNETYSVSFSTTRLGSIATGFRLTMAGEGKLSSGISGVDGGVLIAKGETLRRDYKASTETYGDPMYKQMNGTVIVADLKKLGIDNTSLGAVVLSPASAQTLIVNTIGQGDPIGFLLAFMPGVNIKVGKPSRIMNALKGNKSPGRAAQKTMSQAKQDFGIGMILCVQDIIQTYLPILGVELYWNGGDEYIIEEPRILDPSNPKGTVSREDIIEKTIGADVFNVPDAIIPRFPSPNVMNKESWDRAMVRGLMNITSNIRGSENLKVTIFDVPPVHLETIGAGMNAFLHSKASTTGLLPTRDTGPSNDVSTFFTEFAFSSAMYGIASGTVVCTFQPQISIPAAWYTIDGEKLFISDIRHEISRFRAVTILTVAATEDTVARIPVDGGGGGGGDDENDKDDKLEKSKALVKNEDKNVKEIRKNSVELKRFHPKKGKNAIKVGSNGGLKIGTIFPDATEEKKKIKDTITYKERMA